MITLATAYAQPQRGQLFPANVYTGCPATALCERIEFGEQVNDRLLEVGNELLHTPAATVQIHKHVDHALSGTMIGDITATIAMHNGHTSRIGQLATLTLQADGKHGRMFEQPDLVCGGSDSALDQAPHLAPGGKIAHASELAYNNRVFHDATPA